MKGGGSQTGAQSKSGPEVPPAQSWAPLWLRRAAGVLGVGYLLAVWLDAAGTGIPDHVLPPSLRFFTQVAELFPKASTDSIEWRVRGWRCDLSRFEEVDVRPYFPIRRDDKESRFDRAMFFHHRQRAVLQALDEYIVNSQNRARPDERIGGVILMSLREPIPPLGEPGPRAQWTPLADLPPSIERRYWYTTAVDARQRRCQVAP